MVRLPQFLDREAEIFIPAGEHMLSEPLVLERNVTLRGEGSDKSKLRFDRQVGGALIVVRGATVLIEDVDVTGAGREFDIVSGGTGTVTLRRCTLHGARRGDVGGDAVCVEGELVVRLESCVLAGNDQAGVTVYDRGRIEIRDSSLSRNRVVGLKAWDAATAVVRQSRLENNGEQGVLVQGEARVDIEDSDIACNGRTGVQFEAHASGTLAASRLTRNVDANVYVADEATPRVVGCCLSASTNGVYAVDRARPLIEDSRLSDNDFGVYARDDAAPSISRNRVESRREDNGIVFRDRAGGRADDNDCTGSHIGFIVEDRARPHLARNVARQVIVAPGASPTLVDNMFEEELS